MGELKNLIKYFAQYPTGSLWWVWKTLLSSVLVLYVNSKTPVHRPNGYITQ